MKLYYTPGACSLALHVTLQEAGLAFDREAVDLRTHQTAGGENFYTINPKGYVPALRLDDGSILTENPAVLQYVADQAPEKKLAPAAGTMERYRLQEWLGFIGSELHKTFGPLYNPACPEETKKTQLERIANRLAFVDRSLEGRTYLLGDDFTVADAYLLPILNWSVAFGIDLAQWPALAAYRERVLARPAVHATLVAEGLAKA